MTSRSYSGLPSDEKFVDHCSEDEDDHFSTIHRPVMGSYFDISFKPNPKVGYDRVFPQILACMSAISFYFPIGLTVAYSAIFLPELEKHGELNTTKEDRSWIASITVLTVPPAALLTGILVDSIGRVNTLIVNVLPNVIGWILIALGKDLYVILIGRMLTGFSIAMVTGPATVYTTEVARPDLRGTLLCFGPALTSAGMLLVYLAGWFLPWRIVAGMNALIVFVPLLLTYLFTPESPQWLISKGRYEDATKSFRRISQYRDQEVVFQRQMKELIREHELKTQNKMNAFEKFKENIIKPTTYKPFFILSACFFFQQFSGVYILIFYAVDFFEEIGSAYNVYLMAAIVGLLRMIVGFIAGQLLYRFGRRILCLCSIFSTTILIGVSAYFTNIIKENSGKVESWIQLIPVVCILLYISASTIGLLSVPWTMSAELYALEVRGIMQGVTMCVAHVLMFASIKYYYVLDDIFGGISGLQYFFAFNCFVAIIFIFFFLPETHKKTLDEIQQYFNTNTIYVKPKRDKNDNKISKENGKNVDDALIV